MKMLRYDQRKGTFAKGTKVVAIWYMPMLKLASMSPESISSAFWYSERRFSNKLSGRATLFDAAMNLTQ